jgi:hypothetical protein
MVTTAGFGAGAFYGLRWLARQLEERPERMRAVAEHVLIPLFGTKPDKRD